MSDAALSTGIDDLVARLEAAEGRDLKLNAELAKLAGHKVHSDELWIEVHNLMEPDYAALAPLPDYTGSIDTALPGENIVLVQFGYWRIGAGWRAIHADKNKNPTEAIAHTEALARRLAALKARDAVPIDAESDSVTSDTAALDEPEGEDG